MGIYDRDYVRPQHEQHYSMGGIRTDYRGESPTLRGLFSAGEAACWDMHGFNRLGGNSVAETVVAGMLVGEYIADFCDQPESEITLSSALVKQAGAGVASQLTGFATGTGGENAFELMIAMQEIMTEKVGIFREGEHLQEAVDTLKKLLKRSRSISLRSQSRGTNPELVAAYRVQKMLKLSLCVAYGALRRTESRGAHYRRDYPRRDDAQWLKRTLATWPDANANLPQLGYEELDIMKMELPPGWRGYGGKDHIDHPATAQREAELQHKRDELGDVDRFTWQQAAMPYKELLPERYRGRNARLGETDDE